MLESEQAIPVSCPSTAWIMLNNLSKSMSIDITFASGAWSDWGRPGSKLGQKARVSPYKNNAPLKPLSGTSLIPKPFITDNAYSSVLKQEIISYDDTFPSDYLIPSYLYFPKCLGACCRGGCLTCSCSQEHIGFLFVIICSQELLLLCMKQPDYITLQRR